MISVLIPARNEAARIEPCLISLLDQDFSLPYVILVLDDRSEDDTAEVVRRLARTHPRGKRLRVLRGAPLPDGWLGKPWACAQLARRARGRWLLFVDADTFHDPGALERTAADQEASRADVLSGLTRQVCGTPMEALVIPAMAFCLLSFVPVSQALHPRSWLSRFAGVSGQFLFVSRKAYRRLGGHTAVRGEVVEDLAFGRLAVARGLKVVLRDFTDVSACRMYTSAGEVWRGFSKNVFPAVGYSVPALLAAEAVLFGLGVLPFLFPFLPDAPAHAVVSAGLAAGTQWAVRLHQAFRYGLPISSALLHPVGMALFGWIGLNSWLWFATGRAHWKGRPLKAPSIGRRAPPRG